MKDERERNKTVIDATDIDYIRPSYKVRHY